MKSTKLLLALSAICTGLYSQPFTGIDTYVHSTRMICSDGNNTTFNSPGNIIAGYQPVTSSSAPLNIYIDKTDPNGDVPGGVFFHNEYKFAADNINPCGTSLIPAVNCYGVSVNEIKFPAPMWYNMVAGFDNGCLYSELDPTGIPMGSNYYVFPSPATNVTKPLIKSSNIMLGRSYIAGSYFVNGVYQMYVMMNGLGGGPLGWSISYMNNTGGELVPSAIIESPYSPTGVPELIVVGTYNIGSTAAREGFFARFDGTTGNLLAPIVTYGTGGSSNERCLAVNVAPGFNGFVIGGTTDANTTAGTSWIMTVDMMGNLMWSSVIRPSTGINGDVVGVASRLNTYGFYEYYGVSTANNAMTVIKLDGGGGMFSQAGNTNNEFLYNDNIGARAVPAAMNFLDSGTGGTAPTDGIQVFGRDATPVSNLFIARACFNGAAGTTACTTTNIRLNSLPNTFRTSGPSLMAFDNLNPNPGPFMCSQFNFAGGLTAVQKVAPCDATTLPAGGNQSKTSGVTGISTVSTDADAFSVSPNPVADKMVINYSSSQGSNVTISLYNNLGQLVTPAITPESTQGDNTAELDLSRMNINSGVYFVTVVADGVKTTKKIVYTK